MSDWIVLICWGLLLKFMSCCSQDYEGLSKALEVLAVIATVVGICGVIACVRNRFGIREEE